MKTEQIRAILFFWYTIMSDIIEGKIEGLEKGKVKMTSIL